jgi:rubrerythrin
MAEKWFCPKCGDYIEPEYAVDGDKCPFCGVKMKYPPP